MKCDTFEVKEDGAMEMGKIREERRDTDTHPFQRVLLRQAQSLLCDPILGKRRSEILELPPLNTNGAAIISSHTLTHTHTGTEEEAQMHRVKSGVLVQIRGGG